MIWEVTPSSEQVTAQLAASWKAEPTLISGSRSSRFGKFLEAPLDPLAFEIGIGLRQGPDQPVALIGDRRVGEHAGHRGRDHMRGAEGGAQDARALQHVLVDQLDQPLAELVLHQSLVAVIDGEREEGAARMIDADESAMRDEIEALRCRDSRDARASRYRRADRPRGAAASAPASRSDPAPGTAHRSRSTARRRCRSSATTAARCRRRRRSAGPCASPPR